MCYSLVMIVPKSTNFPPLYLQAIDEKQETAIVTERRQDAAVGSIEIFRHFAKESKSERWERTVAKQADPAAEVVIHD